MLPLADLLGANHVSDGYHRSFPILDWQQTVRCDRVSHDVVDDRTLSFPDVHDVCFGFTRVRRASWLICSGYEMTPVG